MKKLLLCLPSLLFLISCIEDQKTINISPSKKKELKIETKAKSLENSLANLSKIETQEFQLDLVKDSLIEGKDGTIIYFNRKNFNASPSTPLILHLEEYYDFKELFVNQISTETKDGKLLETSGVVNIQVKVDDGSEIELKKGKSIQVIFPDNRIKNNDIYYGERNKEGIVKWEKDSSLVDFTILDFERTRQLEVDQYISIKIDRDSLEYYKSLNDSLTGYVHSEDFTNSSTNTTQKINLQKLNWINIDTEFKVKEWISFKLI